MVNSLRSKWRYTSDETLKENIKECDLGIDFIDSLKPKSYNLKDLKEDNDDYGKKRYGLIAQDILETELKDSVFGKKDGEYGLSYNDLIAPMIKAIQEQQVMLKELKAEIEILKKQIMAIRILSSENITGNLTLSGNQTTGGDLYVTGTSNSLVVISRDNMYVDAGQLYIGADDSTTDDTFRQRVTSGSYFIESRKSGTLD